MLVKIHFEIGDTYHFFTCDRAALRYLERIGKNDIANILRQMKPDESYNFTNGYISTWNEPVEIFLKGVSMELDSIAGRIVTNPESCKTRLKLLASEISHWDCNQFTDVLSFSGHKNKVAAFLNNPKWIEDFLDQPSPNKAVHNDESKPICNCARI